MNSYTYSFGALTLALSLVASALPAVVFANESTSTLEASRTNREVESRDRFEFKNATTSVRSFEKLRMEIDDSDATTTEAEAKIKSRGFFMRLFFGGDKSAADVLSQSIARNQQHIEDLIKLLDQANISEDVRATLNAQITALEDAQAHLKDLAQKERGAWGIFSWRFGGK